MAKLLCIGISYRQGYVEVIPNIHKGYINIETWMIHPDHICAGKEFDEIVALDDAVRANTELELTVETAIALIQLLQAAIHEAKDVGQVVTI